MRSTVKKLMVIFTVFCMLLASLPVQAASPVISKKAITLTVGKSTTLKVKNAKGKIKWKSSNSKIASVSKRGKVIGKKTGKAKITAKYSLQGTTQGNGLTGGVPPVRFSM